MPAPAVVLILGALGGLALVGNQSFLLTDESVYSALPRFWTNIGFCPAGSINHQSITLTLLSPAMQLHLQYVAALPAGAVTHVRIHWLLELLQFVEYTQTGVPIYDYTQLDDFLVQLNELDLYPVIEFMANPGNVFVQNPSRNGFLWADLAYKVTKHYLNMFGARTLHNWRFESWNEPDAPSYNRLNFTAAAHYEYLMSLRTGLISAGQHGSDNLYFKLRGPAGLFKAPVRHPLCWHVLQQCSENMQRCPIDVLTYHRKGNGSASALLEKSSVLLREIHKQFPAFAMLPVANDEADPIADWSTPHAYLADVRYAVILTQIVLAHWHAKLQLPEFQRLESISHDNAFLSFHPYEFSQRTMLAHFRMNRSSAVQHPHSQFVQKPVYAALGLLGKLADLAADVETLQADNCTVHRLRTTAAVSAPTYFSWLLLVPPDAADCSSVVDAWRMQLPFALNEGVTFAYIYELLASVRTDPARVWRENGAPPYPNASLFEAMRRQQTPALFGCGVFDGQSQLELSVDVLEPPWLIMARICANTTAPLLKPQKLVAIEVTRANVLLTWRELTEVAARCLRSYEVWYLSSSTDYWRQISYGWHLPFPSFQFAPTHGGVNGFYRVRGLDIFNRTSEYSDTVEYIEI